MTALWITRRTSLAILALLAASRDVSAVDTAMPDAVRLVLEQRCLECHNDNDLSGGLSLQTASQALTGGEGGPAIAPGDPDGSLLMMYVMPTDGVAEMPKDRPPLSADELALLADWINQGAAWPDDAVLRVPLADSDWWSLRPVSEPSLPVLTPEQQDWCRTPIDYFIAAAHSEHDMHPAPEADRRTLIRRLSYDLTGLPPTPQEVEAFVNDPDPFAYEKLVDRLLASPRYGERWARHWLDVVHYGDTHGYDKDQPRPNAWPYRDWVIRALNNDIPWDQFLIEQLAGDVAGDEPGDIAALGMLAAGPWDFISHVEVPEAKIDGQIARSLDRDDFVRTVMESFASVTIGCARCHDHKFDPIRQEDYYSLQAVFAAIDRNDRPFDLDAETAERRRHLLAEQDRITREQAALATEISSLAGEELVALDRQIAELAAKQNHSQRPEFGYHSAIEQTPDVVKWVQIDLGSEQPIAALTFVGCHDDFNGIGGGFGFPVRYRIEASNHPEFAQGVTMLVDHTAADVLNPGVEPQTVELANPVTARFVRVTATKLAIRQNDYIFALAELSVHSPESVNLAAAADVTALDSIEAPVRWSTMNLVDGYYFGLEDEELSKLNEARRALMEAVLTPELVTRSESLRGQGEEVAAAIDALPTPQMVYAAATNFDPQGNHVSTSGTPREIRVLRRGNVTDPGEIAPPRSLACIEAAAFELPPDAEESQRRLAMARWLANPEHPLTWRSIVNRVWHYHFGAGIVDTPSDFGRMGGLPSHPELLDWLAVRFRDEGGSLKSLHRLICTSSVYRQATSSPYDYSDVDADNRLLWRMERRRLEAEEVRDSVLFVAGQLNETMYGPGFQDFVVEHPEHSPHYEYRLFDPRDPRCYRRSVYRFAVRSQQQPFMTTLDCADPSMQVDRRNETITPQQSLALLNNRLMLVMCEYLAQRVRDENPDADLSQQVSAAFELCVQRRPTPDELQLLADHAASHGLEHACRLLWNLNEFVFVD
jgi:hypothetical protein